MFDIAALTDRYTPRPHDANPDLFASRIAHCLPCRHRHAHTCQAANQLCTVLARSRNGFCQVGIWGERPAPQYTEAISPSVPIRKSSHVLPLPQGEPIIGPVAATEQNSDPLNRTGRRRNLICHLYPLTAGQRWRRTVAHLAARQQLFNGRRLVGVVRDHGCDMPADVAEAFAAAGMEVEVFEFENRSDLGEVVSFPSLLQTLVGTDDRETNNEITFYCHGKGSTWPESASLSHEWADAMFSVCLDHYGLVERSLQTAAICGPFRRRMPLAGSGSPWHFSGTFFWFRHDTLPETWRQIDQVWSGVEAWPGLQFAYSRSACLFLDDCDDLYHAEYWDQTVRPSLRRWREIQSGLMPVSQEVEQPCL